MLLRFFALCELLQKIIDGTFKYLFIAILLAPVWMWAYLMFVLLS